MLHAVAGQQGVIEAAQHAAGHDPAAEGAALDRAVLQDGRAGVAAVLGDLLVDRLQPAGGSLQGLYEPAVVGDEQAGDPVAHIVAHRGGEDVLEHRCGVLFDAAAEPAGVDQALQHGMEGPRWLTLR